MPKLRTLIKYWLPVLVWMGVIFSASGDPSSFEHSSRLIAPIVRWLFPHLPAASVDEIVFVCRKCAHLTEYSFLGVLFWRALRKPTAEDGRPWRWAEARQAVLLVALYAASDEVHQLFVPNRQASIVDVMIDTTGAVLGLGLLWGAGRCLKRW